MLTNSFLISDCFQGIFFFKKFTFLLIDWLLCWVFISVRGLSLVVASGGHSSSRCTGLSLSRTLLLRSTGSRRAGSIIVAHGPSSSAACGRDLPRSGLEPVSPALAGRFSTTASPGKPPYDYYVMIKHCTCIKIAKTSLLKSYFL